MRDPPAPLGVSVAVESAYDRYETRAMPVTQRPSEAYIQTQKGRTDAGVGILYRENRTDLAPHGNDQNAATQPIVVSVLKQ